MEDNQVCTIQNISPYDESFPIMLLSDAFDMQIKMAETTSRKIYEEIVKEVPEFFQQDILPGEERSRMVLDISDDMIENIHNGKIKLVEEHGQMFAQLRENGKYSSKLPVKEEVYQDGGSAEQVAIAMQLKAIQDTLVNITKQLRNIDERVQEVTKGQQIDRLGVYYSGVALYIEANCISSDEMRKNIIAQSVRALSESIFQMTLLMQSDILYLRRKEYEVHKKNRSVLIKEKMDRINQCFTIVHQASLLKAGIYCKEGELIAASIVLEEYARFINGTISSNTELLSQCDIGDKGSSFGVWRSRANLDLDVSKLTKCLKNPEKTIYIDLKDGGEGHESI